MAIQAEFHANILEIPPRMVQQDDTTYAFKDKEMVQEADGSWRLQQVSLQDLAAKGRQFDDVLQSGFPSEKKHLPKKDQIVVVKTGWVGAIVVEESEMVSNHKVSRVGSKSHSHTPIDSLPHCAKSSGDTPFGIHHLEYPGLNTPLD
jgi:hypothetical protein